MRWQAKCLIDSCKGLLPFQNTVRRLKCGVVPYRPIFSRGAFAIDEGLLQVQWLREALGTLEGKKILEIGSGWELLVPMILSVLVQTRTPHRFDRSARQVHPGGGTKELPPQPPAHSRQPAVSSWGIRSQIRV